MDYFVPNDITKFYESVAAGDGNPGTDTPSVLSLRPILENDVSYDTYVGIFRTLIHFQEVGEVWDFRKHTKEKVSLLHDP